LAVVKRALAAVIPERLERPLRSSAFRRLALGKSISFLGDWVMVAVGNFAATAFLTRVRKSLVPSVAPVPAVTRVTNTDDLDGLPGFGAGNEPGHT